jgi:hypothetical protein
MARLWGGTLRCTSGAAAAFLNRRAPSPGCVRPDAGARREISITVILHTHFVVGFAISATSH